MTLESSAERIQHVLESVRQEKQELHAKLRSTEADKREREEQLQDAEREIERKNQEAYKPQLCKPLGSADITLSPAA